MNAPRRRLAALTADTVPLHPDANMIRAWLDTRPDLDPIALSVGDPGFTQPQTPQRLLDYLAEAPDHTHGYQLSNYGLPEARHIIGDYLIADQGLAEDATPGHGFDIALTSHGTRSAIRDFGRWLLRQHPDDPRTPVALCATPAWDYAGILEPLGYQMHHWPLHAGAHWWPRSEDLRAALEHIDADDQLRLAVVIINAQHNPTSRSWPATIMRELYHAAHHRDSGILLDDPYYAVHTTHPHATPQSAPRQLLAALYANPARPASTDTARRHWCAVRSLGKQFGVNGWGIGTITAHPDTLHDLTGLAFQWSFPTGADRQWAMAQWINDSASTRWLTTQQQQLTTKRDLLADTLTGPLHWPDNTVTIGECTPYALVRIPLDYQHRADGPQQWRHDLFHTTGVLLAPANIEHPDRPDPFLRVYLGAPIGILTEALHRIRRADITYLTPPPPQPTLTPAADNPDLHRSQARTRHRAAHVFRRLADTAHHTADQTLLHRIANWFQPAWYGPDRRPIGTVAAATAIVDAATTARWNYPPAFLDSIHSSPPLRVPDQASVLLRAIADHTHPDSAPELLAVADILASDTHRAVDDAISAYLLAQTMQDPALGAHPHRGAPLNEAMSPPGHHDT